MLYSVTSNNSWCPYCCTGEHILCKNNECQFCFKKSFASHEKSKYWNYEKNENLIPRNFTISTAKKFWFDCDICKKSFNIGLNTINSKNTWCNCTNNKTETKLLEWLTIQKYKVEYQKKFEWCKKIMYLPFDFYLKDYNIIIELDGIQHYEDVVRWKSSYKTVQENDKYKSDLALLHNITVIRILQHDIWFNKNDWENILKEKIKKYEKPSVILIGIDNHISVNNNTKDEIEIDDELEYVEID